MLDFLFAKKEQETAHDTELNSIYEKLKEEYSFDNISEIRIIHGKGTGALRSAVQEELKSHPSIKEFRLGVYGEGENGVTIALLK